LAERARVSRPTISRIERGDGDPTLRVLDSLAAALDVDVAELFARDEAEPVSAGAELASEVRERYSRAGRPRVA
jgi:transcriptional regulator with XRE-family HTH domain